MILGIDQSLSSTGYTVLGGQGALTTGEIKTKNLTGAQRLCYVRDGLSEVLQEHKVDKVVREDYAYASMGRATFSLGELGGVIDCLAYDNGFDIHHMPIQTWKKIVLGSGSVGKDTAYLLVFKNKTGLDFTSDNIADSYGIAKAFETYNNVVNNPQSIYDLDIKIQESLYNNKTKDSDNKKISFKKALKENILHLNLMQI